MLGSGTLEIAIGLILVFIIVSTICTAIREGVESKLKSRAAYLEHGIRQLLADQDGSGLTLNIYNHPFIFCLFVGDYTAGKNLAKPTLLAKGKNLPSYIPSQNFARALMDIAANGKDINVNISQSTPVMSLATMRANIGGVGSPEVQRVLLNAIDLAEGDIHATQRNIENWYESGMERISGWYKRSTQWIIFWVAIAVAVALNVNSITLIDYLSTNDTARKFLVEKAVALSKDTTNAEMSYETAVNKLNELKLPIGWSDKHFSSETFAKMNGAGITTFAVKSIFGWLITALAATLGAPFWFDMLSKFMLVRSTVKPDGKTGENDTKQAFAKSPDMAINSSPVPAQQAGKANDDLMDCCGITYDDDTPDEDLPAAKGGVEA